MIKDVIYKIEEDLATTFSNVATWLDSEKDLMHYAPQNNGWSIRQILEHITLTNHYLLILIRKGVNKALIRAKKVDYAPLLEGYQLDLEKLKAIGEHKSFDWQRPEHMEPSGKIALSEIKATLLNQLQECTGYLHWIPNGEGVLYKTMMSVNNLGKIDVYHYISFLTQHAKRHISQMEKIKDEYYAGNN